MTEVACSAVVCSLHGLPPRGRDVKHPVRKNGEWNGSRSGRALPPNANVRADIRDLALGPQMGFPS